MGLGMVSVRCTDCAPAAALLLLLLLLLLHCLLIAVDGWASGAWGLELGGGLDQVRDHEGQWPGQGPRYWPPPPYAAWV
jgi:hypothetical protein